MVWFLGDNFAAKSYRPHFKKKAGPEGRLHYIKEFYDYIPYVNSKFASSNTNMLSRLQNSLATGFNRMKNGILPRYIIVVLDDDLITYLDYKCEGVATLLRTWVEWLMKQFKELLQARIDQLSKRCTKHEMYFYWSNMPMHSHFSSQ